MKQIDVTQKVGIINVQFIDIIKSQNKLLKNNKKYNIIKSKNKYSY